MYRLPLTGDNVLFKINSCILLFLFEIDSAIDYFYKLLKDGFIRKDLFPLMTKWSRTGLDENKDLCFSDLTSYEAYRALSLSSIITTYYLNNNKPYNTRTWYLSSINYDEPTDEFSYNYDNNCHIDSLGNLGMIENNYLHRPYEALKYFNSILSLDPKNELAKNNIAIITNELQRLENNEQMN